MSIVVNVVGQTSVSVSVGGGIGPAGFITVPGTATLAFGTFQLMPGNGITVSTTDGQFLISSYSSTAVSSLAPVQSVAGRTGAIVLQASDVTAGTFAIGRIPTISYTALSGVPTAFTSVSHTHDASDVASGTLLIGRIPTISYTALSNTPATFAPSAHTHSTTDVVAFTASASAAAPVQSVQSRTGDIVLTRADFTAAAEVHTHSTTDVVAFTAAAAAAAPVQSVAGRTGAISLAVADVAGLAGVAVSGSYTSLSNVPATFAASAHTHSTTEVVGLTASFSQPGHTHSTGDITGYQGLLAQAGYLGPLVTDGTNATWTSRYSIVDPVLVQGAGMTLTRDTSAGSITVAFAGGTSGLAVGSLAPLALGVAAAGSSSNASREDHVHKLPTVGDITAAASTHTHDAAAIASGTIDVARIPTIGYTALSGVPASFAPSAHTHSTTDVVAFTASASAAAPVQSVQSRTGTVTLAAADLTAVTSVTTGVTAATAVVNMISLSAAAYSALATKITDTLYIVSG